jgi:Tfp pilus assembly PilM family ATPase
MNRKMHIDSAIAAPVKIIEIYLYVVSKAGLEPLAIETESIAMGRAMYRSTKLPHVVMVDLVLKVRI